MFFQHLWAANDEALPIGLHHGSLSREARARVEAAMAAGELRAVVATGSLDLGIDWGDVDLVVQVGAPKNVKRLVQRIGRANHRYNAPSRAVLVPSNRFELLECRAALDAVAERTLDGEPRGQGPLDVLCQHILLTACAAPFEASALYAEVRTAGPYRALPREDFDACLGFAATGGYALRAYDRWQRLVEKDGRWQLRDPRRARTIRMNVGTIVDTEKLAVRIRGRGAPLGEVEEDFAATLVPGDTFLIGGETVRYEFAARDDRRGHPPALDLAEGRGLHGHQARHLDAALAPRHRAPRRPRRNGPACPSTPATGSPSRPRSAACPARATSSPRPSRAARCTTSASTASPAATPTRPSACSSPAAWRPPASTRSASSPTTTRC